MPGSGTIQSDPGSPGSVAAQIIVCLYDNNPNTTSGFYTILPNVECIGIQRRKSADPGAARFRYRMGDLLNPKWPSRIEDVFGLNVANTTYVVSVDDQLVVLSVEPDATGLPNDVGFTVLFHGLAEVPQADVNEKTETVTFQAVGIATVLWATPIGGAIYRNGPDTTQDSDTATDRPTRFNPDGVANAVIEANWSVGDDANTSHYPVFMDTTYQGGIANPTAGLSLSKNGRSVRRADTCSTTITSHPAMMLL